VAGIFRYIYNGTHGQEGADDPMGAKRQQWTTLCEQHGVTLAEAAIAFAGLPTVVSKVVMGFSHPQEVAPTLVAAQQSTLVPAALWHDAQAKGLLLSSLSLPAVEGYQPMVISRLARECSTARINACAALMWATPEFAWAHNEVDGKVDCHISETTVRMLEEAAAPDDELQSQAQWHVIAAADGTLLAAAKSFVRTVSHSDGVMLPVLALSNVACVDTARGKGYGRDVVLAALGRLQRGRGLPSEVTHSLFETAIPSFYENLGAKLIDKSLVINSTGDGVAFEDEHVMIYPGSMAWPAGQIDLRGPGY
jgi:hypothetical protein